MSVILRDQNGKIKLYCKGADNVILPRLLENDLNIRQKTIEHIAYYANIGLRTLLLGYKEISENDYKVIYLLTVD
jgi:phospholipid-translocating ATPase